MHKKIIIIIKKAIIFTLLLNTVASSRLGTVTKIHPGFMTCSLRIFQVLCTRKGFNSDLLLINVFSQLFGYIGTFWLGVNFLTQNHHKVTLLFVLIS